MKRAGITPSNWKGNQFSMKGILVVTRKVKIAFLVHTSRPTYEYYGF